VRRLDPEALEAVCTAIASRTNRITARDGEHRYDALERRRVELGGMLELARRLDDHRLVRFIEDHKDALTRLIDAD
jgi:hypothetical protein